MKNHQAPFSPPCQGGVPEHGEGEVVCPFQEPVRLLTEGVPEHGEGEVVGK